MSLAEESVPSADTVDAEDLYQQDLVCTEEAASDYAMTLGHLEQDVNDDSNNGIPDGEAALSQYMQAWKAGDDDSEGRIIDLLYKGIIAEDGTVLFAPDHAQMLEFLNQLDQQRTENTYALSWLGWLLCGNSDQNVCEADYARALEIYTRSAELGSGYCMLQIGLLYENGQLGEADLTAAEKWFAKADEAGETTAREALDRVRNAQAQ